MTVAAQRNATVPWLTRRQSIQQTLPYDAGGLGLLATHEDLATGKFTTRSYDRLDRLVGMMMLPQGGQLSAHDYTYYGPTWMRKSASTPEGITSYIYDGFACVSQTTAAATTSYTVPGSKPLWETAFPAGGGAGATATYTMDGMGNVAGLYGATGYAVRYGYDGYGNSSILEGAEPGTHASRVGYRGQLHDTGTSDIYLRNRYYSPSTGTFNRADPIGYDGGMNLYSYAGYNRVMSGL